MFNGNSIGNIATYTCSSGYELIGDSAAICTQRNNHSAIFEPAPPTCQCKVVMHEVCIIILFNFQYLALCSSPADPVNGDVTFTGNSVGSAATYTCSSGFELIGDVVATCSLFGTTASFEPAAPTCLRTLLMQVLLIPYLCMIHVMH